MPRPKTAKKKLISVGSLKLEKRDADEFLESLEFYGIDSIANILRQCALAITRHRKRGEHIRLPLRFEMNVGPDPTYKDPRGPVMLIHKGE
jgi:hypothetical protein